MLTLPEKLAGITTQARAVLMTEEMTLANSEREAANRVMLALRLAAELALYMRLETLSGYDRIINLLKTLDNSVGAMENPHTGASR